MTHAAYRLLIADGDRNARKILSILFEASGFRVVAAETCELAIRQAKVQRPDAAILALGPSNHDGLSVVEQIRTWSPLPIIVLGASVQERQRLAAFELGADDFVTKPFSNLELLARVRAVMRRAARSGQPDMKLGLGDIIVELGNRTARHPSGETVKLTLLEHRILECLVRHADRVATHAQILKEVWGPYQADVRSLRVHVKGLRRKLEYDPTKPRYILTEPGIGYRLITDTATNPSISRSRGVELNQTVADVPNTEPHVTEDLNPLEGCPCSS
jgi:two-component system, OmpR family, KDP operon response regulator KdpE